MQMIPNMDQQRMEWLLEIGIRSVEDIKLTGPEEVYKLLKDAGHPEDQHFYYALLGAVQGLETIEVIENVRASKEGEGK